METGANKDIVPNSVSGTRSMLQIDLLTLSDIRQHLVWSVPCKIVYMATSKENKNVDGKRRGK